MTSSCRKVVAPSILDPVLNASAAPVMEIHPALELSGMIMIHSIIEKF